MTGSPFYAGEGQADSDFLGLGNIIEKQQPYTTELANRFGIALSVTGSTIGMGKETYAVVIFHSSPPASDQSIEAQSSRCLKQRPSKLPGVSDKKGRQATQHGLSWQGAKPRTPRRPMREIDKHNMRINYLNRCMQQSRRKACWSHICKCVILKITASISLNTGCFC